MTPYIKMRLANKAAGEFRAEANVIWLYDVIASDDDEASWLGGVSPKQFIAALASTSGPVTLRVNSPGGSVFGAQAMVAAMRAHAQPITVQVDSLAASAASVIAAEAAKLVMVPGAMLMIHKAWAMAVGNEADMRQLADLLSTLDGQIASTYAACAGGDPAKFIDLMAAETWLTADQAKELGLADEIVSENLQRPAAQWNLSAYAKAPMAPEPAEAPAAPVETDEPAETVETPIAAPDMQARRAREVAARLVATAI